MLETQLNIPAIDTLWAKTQAVQNLDREGRPPIENLVCEGGGVKGVAYVGALEILEQNGILKNIKRVAGSSAGSIVAMMIAVGYSPEEIKKIMCNEVDFTLLMDRRVEFDPARAINISGMQMGISDLLMLFQHQGLYKGKKLHALIKKFIARKLKEKIKSIKKEDFEKILEENRIVSLKEITFAQYNRLSHLYPELGLKELFVTGTNLSDASLKVFSAESDPNMKIADAIRISMSFPFGFEPVLYEGHYYADGGIADNYPMQIFDQAKFLTYGLNDAKVNPCTLGLLVDSEDEIKARWRINDLHESELTIGSYIVKLIKALEHRTEILQDYYHINSIQIFDEDIDTMDLNLSNKKKQKLILSGKKAMQHYVENYLGTDVLYDNLPAYKDIYEKYYSKGPVALIRIIEKEVWPLMQELRILNQNCKESDVEKELIKLDEKLLSYSPLEVKEQYELYSQFQALADAIEQKKEAIENKKIMDEIKILKKKMNKEIFKIIEKQSIYKYIKENGVIDKLNKTEEILNEQMDVLLAALAAYQKNYPDPRINEKIAHTFFQEREKHKIALIQKEIMDYGGDAQSAEPLVQPELDLFCDLMQFGVKVDEAKQWSSAYFAMINVLLNPKENFTLLGDEQNIKKQEIRVNLFSNLLLKEMQRKGIVIENKEDEIKEKWIKKVNQYLAECPRMTRGYAEYLAKESLLKEYDRFNPYDWMYSNERTEVSLKRIQNLREVTNRLSKGIWRDNIMLTNQEDVIHNLTQMRVQGKETYGKHESAYTVDTVEKKIEHKQKFLCHQSLLKIPPIKFHILTPQKAQLQNPDKTIKEIIIAFDEGNAKEKEKTFLMASKNAKMRKHFFDLQKEEILKQVKWALHTAKSGSEPLEAQFKITLVGEGLAGLDAQYLFEEIVNEMNEGKYQEFQEIKMIDVLLTDPVRVPIKDANALSQKVHELKQKKQVSIYGYHLIHQNTFAGMPIRRKAKNYIGDESILSRLSPKDAYVEADFRESLNEKINYQNLNNQKNPLLLRKELNKKKYFYQSQFYRNVNYRIKQLKSLGRYVFLEQLPKIAKMFGKLPFQVGGRIVQNLCSPIFRIIRSLKAKNELTHITPNWSAQLNEKLRSQSESKIPENFSSRIENFIQKGSPKYRLARHRPPIENIVMEGGNFNKAIAFSAALEKMEKKDMLNETKRISGSSMGGVVATLWAIGYTPSELIRLFSDMNFKDLMDEPFSLGGLDTLFEIDKLEIGISGIISLFVNKGLYQGEAFARCMEKLIAHKVEDNLKKAVFNRLPKEELQHLNTMKEDKFIDQYLHAKLTKIKAQYGIINWGKITFKQIEMIGEAYPELNVKSLFLTGTKISDASLKIFSSETEPQMTLVEALRITTCFPGAFMPVEYNGEYYVEGGIANNYPVEMFDAAPFLSHGLNEANVNPCTLGILVDTQKDIDARWGKQLLQQDMSLPKFVKAVLKGLHNRSEILRDRYNINSIQLSDNISMHSKEKSASALGLVLKEKDKERLIQNAREGIQFYHDNYCQDVMYSHLSHFDNLYQKYFSKEKTELKRILQEEITPLLLEYEKLSKEVYIHDLNNQQKEKAQKAYRFLLTEKKVLEKALNFKELSKKTKKRPVPRLFSQFFNTSFKEQREIELAYSEKKSKKSSK